LIKIKNNERVSIIRRISFAVLCSFIFVSMANAKPWGSPKIWPKWKASCEKGYTPDCWYLGDNAEKAGKIYEARKWYGLMCKHNVGECTSLAKLEWKLGNEDRAIAWHKRACLAKPKTKLGKDGWASCFILADNALDRGNIAKDLKL